MLCARVAQILLELISLAMMVRVLLPIFFDPEDNKIYAMTVMLSEPLTIPVRSVLVKLNIGQNSIIDWGFFATYIIISLLRAALPVF